jgi:hypothetical protein
MFPLLLMMLLLPGVALLLLLMLPEFAVLAAEIAAFMLCA